MSDYESRVIRGWRGRLDDAASALRERVCTAPAFIFYFKGIESVSSDRLAGHTQWFGREFGPERAQASAELQQLQRSRRAIREAERTPEQIAERSARRRKWWADQSEAWHGDQADKVRARRAGRTQAEQEKARAWFREWRATRSPEWRHADYLQHRARAAAKPELYKATAAKAYAKRRDATLERRRLKRMANIAEVRRREHAYYMANRERINGRARAVRAALRSQLLELPAPI